MAAAENCIKSDEHLLPSATLKWRFPPCWQGALTIGQVHKMPFQSNSRSSQGCVTQEVITLQTPASARVEQTDRLTKSEGFLKIKEIENKILLQLQLVAFVITHIPPLNPTGPSLNLPACPDLVVSRIILYLYLNTHKAYTGKGTTTKEKTKVIHRAEGDETVK